MYDFSIGTTNRYGQIIDFDYSDFLMITESKKGFAIVYTTSMGILITVNTVEDIYNAIEEMILKGNEFYGEN